MPVKTLNAVVSEPVFVTTEAMILRVAPDGWELPEYIPGQFAVLGLPGNAARIDLSDAEEDVPDPDRFISRAYSIASSSKQKEYLEFYVSLVRSGALTPRLFALSRGDKVHLGSKISGIFTLDKIPEDADLVLMGTGTGIAPYISMIRSCITPDSARRFAVVHGARHSWDLGYRSELSSMDRMVEGFDYIPIISRPNEEIIPWGGEAGYVQDIWKRGMISELWGRKLSPESTCIFLCGNPGMVNDSLEMLAADGYSEHKRKEPGQVHLERYW